MSSPTRCHLRQSLSAGIPILASVIGILGGCVATTSLTGTIPGPADVRITPGSSDLPREVAAFLGTWEGVWDVANLPARLIVERINIQSADVVYAWGDDPEGQAKGGWRRYTAKTLPGGILQWQTGLLKFTFYMAKDRMRIEGVRERANGSTYTIIMTR